MNKMKQICPICEEGVLTPTTRTIVFEHGLTVEGLEVSICNLCNSELVFPEQSKKNQIKIKKAGCLKDVYIEGNPIINGGLSSTQKLIEELEKVK